MADTYARFRQLIGSTATWSANNIVLGLGEVGIEQVSSTDVRIKVGDGTLTWSALPYASASSSTINAATQAALDAKLALSGGDMSGVLRLASDPTGPLQAATKQYVDNADTTLATSIAGKLATSGGTLTGFLSLNADPTSSLHAATKSYADGLAATKLAKSGDSMTGALLLAADPTVALGAATKQYVDSGAYQTTVGGSSTYAGKVVKLNSSGVLDSSLVPRSSSYLGTVNVTVTYALAGTYTAGDYFTVSTSGTVDSSWSTKLNGSPSTAGAGQFLIYNLNGKFDLVGDTSSSSAISGKLDKAGGTMTGALLLNADPTVNLGAATKQSVDARLALTGGTMSGLLVLSANPTATLGAATKGYVDAADSNITSAYTAADSALNTSLTTSIAAKLPLSGGTLTGALTLSGSPTSTNQAATKGYVDTVTSTAVLASNNLSDLADKAAARGNLSAAGTGVTNTFTASQVYSTGASAFAQVFASTSDRYTLYNTSTGAARWWQGVTSEASGSSWGLFRYSDAGTYVSTPVSISRSTGQTTIEQLAVSGTTVAGLGLTAQYPTAISIPATGHATSRRAAISVGSWIVLQDLSANGTLDFALYNTATRFTISATGAVAIAGTLSVGGVNVPKISVGTSAPSGPSANDLWVDTN